MKRGFEIDKRQGIIVLIGIYSNSGIILISNPDLNYSITPCILQLSEYPSIAVISR